MPLRAATLAIVGALAIGAGLPARSATFAVTTAADAGAGSLRAAVTAANGSADASNTILFSLPANSTIVLLSPLEDINSQTLIFDASASPGLSIDGGQTEGATQPFLVNGFGSAVVSFRNVSYADGEIVFAFNEFTFDESGEGTIDGDLFSAATRLVKTGAGTTTLNEGRVINLSPGGGFLSEAQIDQGTLAVNGDIFADTVLVGPQGTLAGDSDISSGVIADVIVQGRVAPSTTTGRLRIGGAVAFESGSVLDVDLQPGDGDRVDVTGGAVSVASGARIEFRAQPSDYVGPSTVPVLTSASAITGSFALGTDYALLNESIDVSNPNVVAIALAPNGLSLADFAFTPNQRAVAQHLQAATPGASGDLADALDAIERSTAEELPALLDSVGGESLTAFATGRQILSERTARALHRRTRDLAWGDGRAFYLSDVESPWPAIGARGAAPVGFLAVGPDSGGSDVAASGAHTLDHDHPVRAGAWLDAFGLAGEIEGDSGEADLDTTLYGGTLGIDAWLAERVLIGLTAGYARSDIDPDDRDADVTGDTVQGALYAGWTDPRGFVSGYGRYAYSFQNSTRRIESTQLRRSARARWNAQDYGAGGEAGVTVFSLGAFALQPIAGIDWLRLTEESYTEKSAGALGLDVDPEDLESVVARFGGRLFGRIDIGRAVALVPELRAFWQREFGDRERVLDARLSGAPGASGIAVRGPELPRDVLILGVGWGASLGERLQVLVDYDALLDSDRVEHQGNLAMRVRF